MTSKITRYAKGLWRFVDVGGWQKWFGAAVLGFAFVLDVNSSFSVLQFQGLALGIPLILCYIQCVNDYFDVEIDKQKQKVTGKELIVSNIISKKVALLITLLALLVGLLSSWITSVGLFVLSFLAALFGTLYSVPPFRLKMKYPYSTLVQFSSCFLPFLGGVASLGIITFQTIAISSVFAVLSIMHRFVHEIQNYKIDLQIGKETVAVTSGLRTAETFLKLTALVGVGEFALFFISGWFSAVFLFLFILYLIIVVAPMMLRYFPQSLRTIVYPLTQISSFILLFIVLGLYRKYEHVI